MPLLNKKPFVRNPIPEGKKDDDKVFYCDVTDEIFESYQEFAERIILCNSLVWSCGATGKSGLTYQEAEEYEKSAQKVIREFPKELRKPILYLITLTHRTALSELTEDIFLYVRDRYFVGEYVEHGDQWNLCRVRKVIMPRMDDDVIANSVSKSGDRQYGPPGRFYQYELESMENSGNPIIKSTGSCIRRRRLTYTRDKNSYFIKHFIYKYEGIWQVKPAAMKKYNLSLLKFDDIFTGPLPKFPHSDSPKKPQKKSQSSSTLNKNINSSLSKTAKKQESIDKYLKPKSSMDDECKSSGKQSPSGSTDKKVSIKNGKRSTEKRRNTGEIIEQEMLEKRQKILDQQQQIIEKKQQKQLDLQRKRDEKKKIDEFLKEWSKTREDLELEDLIELPPTTPISLTTANKHFGDIIMIYEFFQSFFEEISVKNFFPAGVTIDLVDRAVSQKELAGPLCDFIHLLLSAIFKLQEDEEDDITEPYDTLIVSHFENLNGISSISGPTIEKLDNMTYDESVSEAAIIWPLVFHGVPLPKLGIDATTVSEVLRLHFLSAGGRVSEKCSRWRIQEKNGFIPSDDPAVHFRNEHKHIIQLLGEKNIAALSTEEKISVLDCLINQIIMYAGIRNMIVDSVESNRQKRQELKASYAAEIKKEREMVQKRKEKKNEHEKIDGQSACGDESNDNYIFDKQLKDVQKRKDDLLGQLTDLITKNMHIQLSPLGQDRAYRRFWIFPHLPGIFVEDNELHPPPCLPRGTPAPDVILMKEKNPAMYVKKLFQKEYNKENHSFFISPKKMYGELMSKEETSKHPLSCWGNNETCPVHAKNVLPENILSKIVWSYYKTQSEYESLLESLNTRGKRESKLKALLTQHRDTISWAFTHPTVDLNKFSAPCISNDEAEQNQNTVLVEIRKSARGNPTYEDALFSHPPNTDVETVLDSVLRTGILTIEERVNAGGLGHVRVLNRDAWLNAIKNNKYIQGCPSLKYGEMEMTNGDEKSNTKGKKYTRLEKLDILNEFVSQPSESIKNLAKAILQLEQAVELHYLKPPLGIERTRKDQNRSEYTDILRRWECSLMSSTSYAQLFLHLNTLENSIAWNRSGLNASCRICRKRGDAQNMLLCDGCNRGHHMYCLKPKLTKIPKGDWHCSYCRPPQKEPRQHRERKKVVFFGDSEDETNDSKKLNGYGMEKMELSDSGKCIRCNEDKPKTIGCSKCRKRYHLACLLPPLRRVPSVNWECNACRHISAKKDEDLAMFLSNGQRRRTRHSLEYDYSRELPLDNATLQELLEKVLHHEDCWPFKRPVSRSEASDYMDIVKKPMDFGTIKHKLNMLQYHTNSQVINDSMLVFYNCFLYNRESTDVYETGVRLMEYFKKLCCEMNLQKELKDVETQNDRTNSDLESCSDGNRDIEENDENNFNEDDAFDLITEVEEYIDLPVDSPPTKRFKNS